MEEKKTLLEKAYINCFECGKKVIKSEAHYWYHGDQDDLVCSDCGKNLRHTDTCYAGKTVC